MRAGDLLLWVTGVPRVTMFGRKSVGSGLTTRYLLDFPFAFLPDFSPKLSLSSLSSLEKTPAWTGLAEPATCPRPVDHGPATGLADLKARREAGPWFPGMGTCHSPPATRRLSIRALSQAAATWIEEHPGCT
jgi:hypothetical protein